MLGPRFIEAGATQKLELRQQHNIINNTIDEHDINNRHYGYCITLLPK